MPPDIQAQTAGPKKRPAPYTKPTQASASSALPTPPITGLSGTPTLIDILSANAALSSAEGSKKRRKKRKRTQDGSGPEVSASGSQAQVDEVVKDESPASQPVKPESQDEITAQPSSSLGNVLTEIFDRFPPMAERKAERAARKRAKREAKISAVRTSAPVADIALPQASPANDSKKDEKLAKLQKRLDKALASAKAAEEKAESLRVELERYKEEGKDKDKLIERHARNKEELEEVVQCGVCMDTLKDPHVLSCGHIGCKDCLLTWFRSPGAYAHPPTYPIVKTTDLQYYTKQCHTCRATIVRRPTRMYIVSAVLGAMGLEGLVPTEVPGPPITAPVPTSPDATRFKDDPWFRTFPPEKDSYKLWDDADAVHRCPACGCEVDHQHCMGCGAEFSDGGEESNWESADEDMSDLDEHERAHILGLWRGSDEDDSEFGLSDEDDIDRERELLLGLSPRGPRSATGAAAVDADEEAEDRAAQHRATRHRLAWLLDTEAAESGDNDSEGDNWSDEGSDLIIDNRRSWERRRSPSAEGYDFRRGDDEYDSEEGSVDSFINDEDEEVEAAEGSQGESSSGSDNENVEGSGAEMDEDDLDIGLSVEDGGQAEGSDADSEAGDGSRRTRSRTGAAGRPDHPALAELRRRRELRLQRG